MQHPIALAKRRRRPLDAVGRRSRGELRWTVWWGVWAPIGREISIRYGRTARPWKGQNVAPVESLRHAADVAGSAWLCVMSMSHLTVRMPHHNKVALCSLDIGERAADITTSLID